MIEKNQRKFWDTLGADNPDAAVIDPSDKLGHKNKYIVSIRNREILFWLQKINKNGLVLDFGCGSGLTSECLESNGLNVVGMDVSMVLLRKAHNRRSSSKLNVLQYDGTMMPFGNDTFDFIVTYVVLNHLTNQEKLTSVLNELNRIVKRSGVVIAIEQTRRSMKMSSDGSKKQLTINEFKQYFDECNFQTIKTKIIRYGHFILVYLIRFGLIKEKWFKAISGIEAYMGRYYTRPLFDYADTLFMLKKK